MSNSFFHFKQFTVHQQHCAMKVCTDACLFGAWVAHTIENNAAVKTILDIGTGTGLLSLMLAQKNNALIDAVELNTEAALQASQNIASSPWKHRINIFKSNILQFEPGKQYDFIISNPPFFEDDLKSARADRNDAMHSSSLNLQTLLQQIKRLLAANGKAAVLIPYHRSEYFEKLLQQNSFFIQEKLEVKQSVYHPFFRSQYIFSAIPAPAINSSLAIHTAERKYSSEFERLLRDYYLKL